MPALNTPETHLTHSVPPQFAQAPECARLNKNCALNRNGCGYRFTRADTEAGIRECPKCGKSRICDGKAMGTNAKGEPRPCQMHGGKSPSGLASKTFKHGGASQAMIYQALGPRYKDFLDAVAANPDLLDLTPEIMALRARFLELMNRTNRGDSETQAKQAVTEATILRRNWADLKSAQLKASQANQAVKTATNDQDRQRAQKELEQWSAKATEIYDRLDALMVAHEDTLKANQTDWQTWNQALDTAERTATLADKQDKRLQRARWFYTWLEVQRMFKALVEAVNRHVRTCPGCGHSLATLLQNVQNDWTSVTLNFYNETQDPIDMKEVEKQIAAAGQVGMTPTSTP